MLLQRRVIVSHHLHIATLLAAMTLATAAPSRASASWDAFEARTPRVHIVLEHTELADDVEDLEGIATWIRRIEAILPAGARVDVDDHQVRVTCVGLCRGAVRRAFGGPPPWGGELEALFAIVADEVGASQSERRALLERSAADVYTVQVLETSDPDEAQALAEALNTSGVAVESFVETGGFPSPDEIARVVEVDVGDDVAMYRVELGAFIDRVHARQASRALLDATGLRGLVRTLASDVEETVEGRSGAT